MADTLVQLPGPMGEEESSVISFPDNPQVFKFCGVSKESLELGRKRQAIWRNKRKLAYYIANKVAGVQDFAALVRAGYNEIQSVCGLEFVQTSTLQSCDIQVTTRSIDGQNGVLAEHELPPGDDRRITGWYDRGEVWTDQVPPGNSRILFPAVFLHEACHGCGLPHTNVPKSLLNPFYDAAIYHLTAWEKEELKSRYGEPIAATPPPPIDPLPPPSPGQGVPVRWHNAVGYYIPVQLFPKQ